MDARSLELLVEEVFERAEWYGGVESGSRIPELFALGWVSGARQLGREDVELLRKALNAELSRLDQRAMGRELIQATIRNVN